MVPDSVDLIIEQNGEGMPILFRLILNLFSITTLLAVFSTGIASEYYKWIDKDGTIHISDSLAGVPQKYRDQIKSESFSDPNQSTPESKDLDKAPDPEETTPKGKGEEDRIKRIEVSYLAHGADGAKRIIIPVRLNDSVTAQMALDTGAPGMIIWSSLAERLGIFRQDEGKLRVMAGGIGGRVPAIRTIIDKVQVSGAEGRFVPTTVTPPISNSFEGLIGMDFMSNYSVEIDSEREVLVFKEMPDTLNLIGGHDENWWRATFKEFAQYRANWKKIRQEVNHEIKFTSSTNREKLKQLEKLREVADAQYKEADKLFGRLNHYASQNSVPMHWREF